MQINKVGIAAKNIPESVKFYELLGFTFEQEGDTTQHTESTNSKGAKLMIDSEELVKELLGESPRPGNISVFAVEFESAQRLDEVAGTLTNAGYKFKKQPWDAFWGQRYAVVIDPNGFLIDLYAYL